MSCSVSVELNFPCGLNAFHSTGKFNAMETVWDACRLPVVLQIEYTCLLSSFFSDASLHLVGSSCNGFASQSSDADFCLMITPWRMVSVASGKIVCPLAKKGQNKILLSTVLSFFSFSFSAELSHSTYSITYNSCQNLLSQTKIFRIFRLKSQCLLIQPKYSVNPPSSQIVNLNSGDVLHGLLESLRNHDSNGNCNAMLLLFQNFRFKRFLVFCSNLLPLRDSEVVLSNFTTLKFQFWRSALLI